MSAQQFSERMPDRPPGRARHPKPKVELPKLNFRWENLTLKFVRCKLDTARLKSQPTGVKESDNHQCQEL
jgi:hypothetical protein